MISYEELAVENARGKMGYSQGLVQQNSMKNAPRSIIHLEAKTPPLKSRLI